jgi:hypothetical protein
LAGGVALSVGGLFWVSTRSAPAQNTGGPPLEVEIAPISVPQQELAAIAGALMDGRAMRRSDALRAAQPSGHLRVLSVRVEEPRKAADAAQREERWRAVVYDYERQRTLIMGGRLGDIAPDRVRTASSQPLPPIGEWRDARDVLLRHGYFGPLFRTGEFIAYRPMPPLVVRRGRRLITVGVLPKWEGNPSLREVVPFGASAALHEIVAVDLGSGEVHRFAERAPDGSLAGRGPTCGAPPAADQETTTEYEPGAYRVRVKRGGTIIWDFTAVRPAASSGLRGSGVQLNDVVYRGKKVLSRAHVPILTVRYAADLCGPYRDWQSQESMLRAEGVEVAPGFLKASSRPSTIVQNGTDVGTFLGTALWAEGEEITLMAELEAGWYRYLSQWTLNTDGTIKARWGFDGVRNRCVCNAHYHHAYWRLDFDLGEVADNYVQELRNGEWRGEAVPRSRLDAALAGWQPQCSVEIRNPAGP